MSTYGTKFCTRTIIALILRVLKRERLEGKGGSAILQKKNLKIVIELTIQRNYEVEIRNIRDNVCGV